MIIMVLFLNGTYYPPPQPSPGCSFYWDCSVHPILDAEAFGYNHSQLYPHAWQLLYREKFYNVDTGEPLGKVTGVMLPEWIAAILLGATPSRAGLFMASKEDSAHPPWRVPVLRLLPRPRPTDARNAERSRRTREAFQTEPMLKSLTLASLWIFFDNGRFQITEPGRAAPDRAGTARLCRNA